MLVSSENILEKCVNQASQERHRKTAHTKEEMVTESRLGLVIVLMGKYLLGWNIQFRKANGNKVS